MVPTQDKQVTLVICQIQEFEMQGQVSRWHSMNWLLYNIGWPFSSTVVVGSGQCPHNQNHPALCCTRPGNNLSLEIHE